MRIFFSILFVLIAFACLAQPEYIFGYWESNFWKKIQDKTQQTDGDFTVYYKNGEVRYSGSFENGLPTGTWKYYRREGTIAVESQYFGSFNRFDRDGIIIEKGTYKQGTPTGSWTYSDNFDRRSIANKEYDCASEKLYEYLYTNNIDLNDTKERDTILSSVSNGEFFKYHVQPELYFSVDLSYTKKMLDIEGLNDYFGSYFGYNFAPRHDDFKVNFTISPAKELYARVGLGRLSTQSVNFGDSLDVILGGGSSTINVGYDIIRGNRFCVVPNIGFGYQDINLRLIKRGEINMSNTLFDEDCFDKRYVSRSFITDFNLDVRLNIAFSGYCRYGFFVGCKAGYIMTPSKGNWGDTNGKIYPTLLRSKVKGEYIMISLGIYALS